jgi:HK97 family phage major capsid protein
MFFNVNNCLAEKHELRQKAQALIDGAKRSGHDLKGTELEQFNQLTAKIGELTERLERHAQNLPQLDALPMPNIGPRNTASQNAANGPDWVDPKSGRPVQVLSREQRMSDLVSYAEPGEPLSLGRYLRGIATGRWDGAAREMTAMSEGSLGGGGYLVPAPLSTAVIDRVRNASVMIRAGSKTIPMDSQTLGIARVASDVTPAWHTEAAAITATDMGFEKVTFTAQTLAAIAVLSVELFEDAANLESLIPDAIGKVLAIELDRACLCGTGTAPEPRGLRNQSNVVIDSTTFGVDGAAIATTTPTGAVAWDWLAKQCSALWSVNENANAAIYSARTAGELDLLRSSTGEILLPPGSVANLQRLYTNSIPNTLTQGASHDCSEAFIGDFSQALIGMRKELVLEFSRQANVGATSLFSTMQIGIRAYLRADFQVARPAAFRVVTGIR